MKAEKIPAALAIGAALLLSAGSALADLQSFQFTNFIPSALSITSWPTNTQTTNY